MYSHMSTLFTHSSLFISPLVSFVFDFFDPRNSIDFSSNVIDAMKKRATKQRKTGIECFKFDHKYTPVLSLQIEPGLTYVEMDARELEFQENVTSLVESSNASSSPPICRIVPSRP